MEGLLLACQVSGIRSLKDKSVILSLETMELSRETAGELFRIQGLLVSAYIKEAQPDQTEIDRVNKLQLDDEGRSKSQRQRDILYRIWQHEPKGYKDFDSYYSFRMEQNISKLKNELDALQ